jgi:uncharacterized lipoprotein YbaY/heat shock protein HslJ
MLEITGEITYRERIALPAKSIAVVELRDTSIADASSGIVAELKIDPAGRQVPLPFRLTVDRTKLSPGRRYSVRATIAGPDGQLLWTTTGSHPIEPSAEKAVLGTLMLSRVSSQGSAGPAPGTDNSTLTASGNEPGWKLEIGAREMTLLLNNNSPRVVVSRPTPEVAGDTRRYVTTANGRPLTATIVSRRCADSMTGMPHPYSVVVLFDGQELKGCGGNPAELLQGAEWIVDSLNGVTIPAGSRGTIRFGPNSAVSGRSFCNMYTGTYTLTGENLTISLGASTLMACLPDAGNQEKLFTDLLSNVRRFEITADGALVLHTSDQRTIKARRQ